MPPWWLNLFILASLYRFTVDICTSLTVPHPAVFSSLYGIYFGIRAFWIHGAAALKTSIIWTLVAGMIKYSFDFFKMHASQIRGILILATIVPPMCIYYTQGIREGFLSKCLFWWDVSFGFIFLGLILVILSDFTDILLSMFFLDLRRMCDIPVRCHVIGPNLRSFMTWTFIGLLQFHLVLNNFIATKDSPQPDLADTDTSDMT